MEWWYNFLGWIMNGCYSWVGNYAVAIILFTLISKIILLPVSLWTYFNSIKMVKIQPDINFIKVKYYGQNDVIAEEQAKLQKQCGYHPLLSTVPLFIQLFLLMGVVEVIKQGMQNPDISMQVWGINLGYVPSEIGLSYLWSPILAGLSSWILCVTQNMSSVLQSEQSKWNKYGFMAFSVGLSLYLGWFVAVGTALYWVCSNLLAVAQMYILNGIIRPRRFVDYDKLEKSREALANLQNVGKQKKDKEYYANKKRERQDYKKFFKVVNKHLVFYAESNGYYKYFKGYIEYLLKNSNVTIHYISSDPKDNIFNLANENPRIKAYYIGENRLITLMMKLETDVMVMTMPDLENYHIKRSYIQKDVEYIYVAHGTGSGNLTLRKGALDHFDTIFCTGPSSAQEIKEIEKVYNLPNKNLVSVGSPLVDELRANYVKSRENKKVTQRKKVLIAPSWQEHNIVDSCLEEMLLQLKNSSYEVTVRPHPQEVRLKRQYIEGIKEKFEGDNITIQTDFSSNKTIMEADVLITDWSDISMEFAYATHKPVLFINTPMKIMNPDYKDISVVPMNIIIREKLGRVLELDKIPNINECIEELIIHAEDYKKQIADFAEENIYNCGKAAEAGGQYMIETIRKKIADKKVRKKQ